MISAKVIGEQIVERALQRMPDKPTDGTMTLLLSDVVDSTLLNDRLGDTTMNRLWAEHDRTCRQLMRRWSGLEIGRSDGFLVAFESVPNAVAFAMDYHRALMGLEVHMKARVGMHTGQVSIRENSVEDAMHGATRFEVDGIALPIAARLMATAVAGQTLLSGDSARHLGRTNLRLEAHGLWRLKGCAEPLEILEVGEAGAPFVPPPDSAKSYRVVARNGDWVPARLLPNNLPAERDACFGQREVLLTLSSLFDAGARLVTVTGIGGIGKTRLAQRYARAWLGDFPGGAWFCDLSTARGIDGIVHSVSQGLDVPLRGQDAVSCLGEAIAGRGHCLVLLDNFEQVAEHAEAALGSWLDQAPLASFLVTSREVLGIVGEKAMAMEPLGREEACEMFFSRMQAAVGAPPGEQVDRRTVGSLVDLLDRLPLAIELSAARARSMPVQTQLLRIGDRFKLLASRGGRRDRQATMLAALDWGWDLMSEAEQSALAQLSVFAGGFTLEAAEAVVRADHDIWVADLLQALIEKSWLRVGGRGRFDMLVTVKHFSSEKLHLQGAGEAAAESGTAGLHARHWGYFSRLSEAESTRERCAETDNLVMACRRATAARDHQCAVGCLCNAWAALRLTGPFEVTLALCAGCRAIPGLPRDALARVAWVEGSALYLLGHIERAKASLNESIDHLGPDGGDSSLQARQLRAQVLCALGELESTAGAAPEASGMLQAALAGACGVDDVALQCRALNALGALAGDASRWDDAQQHYDEALGLAMAHGDLRWQGLLLGNLGTLHHHLGRVVGAQHHYSRAIEIAVQIGDRRGEGDRRCNLGLLHLEQGRSSLATAELEAALEIARSSGHVRLQGVALCNIGLAAEMAGHDDRALQAYEQAVAIAFRCDDRRSEGQYRVYLGRAWTRRGRVADAETCLGSAASLLAEGGDVQVIGLLACARAELEIMRSDRSRALAHLRTALDAKAASGCGDETEFGRELSRVMLRVESMPPNAPLVAEAG